MNYQQNKAINRLKIQQGLSEDIILFASLKYFPCPGYPYQWLWQDLEDHQKSGPDGEITTSFEYDGILRLVRVTDTEGNVTTSTYDMGEM